MDRSNLSPSRRNVFDLSLAVIEKVKANGKIVFAAQEAAQLLRENPDCGLSEHDISEHLVRLAVENHLGVDTAR